LQQKLSLTEGSIPRALLLFALPILSGNVLQSLNGSVNAVWVGHFLGQAAFAATGNANVVMFMLFGVMFGFSMATTVMVAQCVGAKNFLKRSAWSAPAQYSSWAVARARSPGLGRHAAAAALAANTAGRSAECARLHAHHLSRLPQHVRIFLRDGGAARPGDSKTPFRFLALSVLLDILLNPLLIFGLGSRAPSRDCGFRDRHAAGAVVSLAALVLHLYAVRHPLRILRAKLRHFRPDWRVVRLLVSKGVPMGLHLFVVSSSMLALTALVNRYGSQETAAFNASMQLWNYVQMPALAIGAAVSSMAAQNVGAGRWDRVQPGRARRACASIW
jgi:Na+-driven multidrug efflux pump